MEWCIQTWFGLFPVVAFFYPLVSFARRIARCVRRGDWKLIKYDVLDGQVRETQLFNLAKNPNEFLIEHHDDSVVKFNGHKPYEIQKDLAELPEYAEKLAEMEALLLSEMKRLKDPHRFWDQVKD